MTNQRSCARCEIRRRLTASLNPGANEPNRLTVRLLDVLCAGEPRTIAKWLATNPDRIRQLRQIAAGEIALTHDSIDQLGATQHVEHLRHRLIVGGLLPEVHHHLALFDRWTTSFLLTITVDTDRQLIATYIAWHQRRRLTRSIDLGRLRPWSTRIARQQTRVAAAFLTWLHQHEATLDGCTQHHIDRWYAPGPSTRAHTNDFLFWARSSRLCNRRLRIPIHKPATPDGMPQAQRVELVARLLNDTTIRLADRVAGLLVALYAQPASRICRIPLDTIHLPAGAPATLDTGGARIELDQATSALLEQLANSRQSTPGAHRRWLFTGSTPGQPMTAANMGNRLRRLGITRDARVSALHELTRQIPSPVLAELIGYNPNFIAERAAVLAAPWNNYPALRRTTTSPPDR